MYAAVTPTRILDDKLTNGNDIAIIVHKVLLSFNNCKQSNVFLSKQI